MNIVTLSLSSVLQAASPPKAREPWKPRPGDGISSNWLIAELTHRDLRCVTLRMQEHSDILVRHRIDIRVMERREDIT